MSTAKSSLESLVREPFWFYLKTHKRQVFIGLSFLLITNGLDTLPPLLTGKVIDLIAHQAPLQDFWSALGALFGVSVLLILFRFAWRVFWGSFHHSVAENLRNRIFQRFTLLEVRFFQSRPVGELMSLITNDVNSFRMALGPGILLFFDGLFVLVFTLPIMMSISLSWTLQTLVLMPLLPFLIHAIVRRIHDNYKIQQDRFADLSGYSQEIVSGIRVIKGYAQQGVFSKLFNNHSQKFQQACNQVAFFDSLFVPLLEIAVSFGAFLLILRGAPEVMAGAISIGSFFAFYQYIDRTAWPMTALGLSVNHIQHAEPHLSAFESCCSPLKKNQELKRYGEFRFRSYELKISHSLTETRCQHFLK